jgi:hypothetical protein
MKENLFSHGLGKYDVKFLAWKAGDVESQVEAIPGLYCCYLNLPVRYFD